MCHCVRSLSSFPLPKFPPKFRVLGSNSTGKEALRALCKRLQRHRKHHIVQGFALAERKGRRRNRKLRGVFMDWLLVQTSHVTLALEGHRASRGFLEGILKRN